jgi:hypothetical protein
MIGPYSINGVCTRCKGTNFCANCGGKGTVPGTKDRCPFCGGTGKCIHVLEKELYAEAARGTRRQIEP